MLNENVPGGACRQEALLLETLPLILRIAGARKHNLPDWASVEDLRQTVALNLLKWKHARPDRELTAEDWLKFASRATVNQIGKYHAAAHVRRETRLAEIEKYETAKTASTGSRTVPIAGNTKVEVESLIERLWRIVEILTLRERCALLLKAGDTLPAIVGRRGCDITSVARALRLELGELFAVIALLPLADEEIAILLGDKTGESVTAKQVLEARFRARAKIRRGLSEESSGGRAQKDLSDDEPGTTKRRSAGGG